MTRRTDNKGVYQINYDTGNVKDVETYGENRKCRKCRCPLTIYTPGDWCHAHMRYGREVQQQEEDKKRRMIHKKASAKHRSRLEEARGNKAKRTWNKLKKDEILVPNAECGCGNLFRIPVNTATELTKTHCIPCRKIERKKERSKDGL